MPLDKNKKISLIHREGVLYPTANTSLQGVPSNTSFPASITIETALVFPIFLFIMVGILFLFRVLQITTVTDGALAATGSWLAVDVEETSMIKTMAYFQKELIKGDCSFEHIVGGRLGIVFTDTEIAEDSIDLKIHYYCRFPVSVFGINHIPITQHVKMKRWTGYQKEQEKGSGSGEEPFVYITPNGEVYHLTKECSHLQLSVRTVGKQMLEKGGYVPCSFCGKDESIYPYYYVTQDGECYHTDLNCRGLKRTIYMIRISEVGSRSACQRCGGG